MNKDWNRLYADVDAWAQSHRDEFVADISRVCRIRSVSVKDFSNPDEPFGKPCRAPRESTKLWCSPIPPSFPLLW